MPAPTPMPVISRGVPAYTNDDFSGAFPASHANDSAYGDTDYWRCAQTPIGNANSGTLIAPVYLAYDLSGVSTTQRQTVVLAWYNDCPGNGAYDPGVIANPYLNDANAYTIDVNAAAGGSLPGSGWVTKVTVSGSTFHSRQHSFDMTGYNWVRINVTAAIGSASNNNVAMNMDIHDAHQGVQDDFIFFGDSITQRAFNHDDRSGTGQGAILPAQINATYPNYFPIWEGAGVGGWTATDLQATFSTWLANFPGRYVALNMGTNDANLAGAYLTNFSSKMTSMVQAVLGAGKIPIIPHIPWGGTANIQTNAPTLNGQIDAIIAANAGTLAGPDLYTYFNANQSLISGDNIHPTDPTGYVAYRNQWLTWAGTTIYAPPITTPILVPTPPPDHSPYLGGGGETLPVRNVQSFYRSGGMLLVDQPYLATAPMVMGRTIPAGSVFLLLFQSPTSGTRNILANGATLSSFTFGLATGETVSGPVLVSSSLSGSIFQVQCTTLTAITL